MRRADVDGFRQREMCRVRLLAERVEDQQIKSIEKRPRLVRDMAAVGEIRELPRSATQESDACHERSGPA